MFSIEQKTFIVTSYYRNGQLINGNWTYSIEACRQEFTQRFPNVIVDINNFSSQVLRVITCFEETGSIEHRSRTGRPRRRTENVVEQIRNTVEEEPTVSVRRLAQRFDVSVGSCHKILATDLHMHPYKMQVYQELLPPDYEKRVRYCQWFQENVNDDVLNTTFFSDEAWFHLTGYVNSQNMRMWSSQNPHYFRETGLHPIKIGVWIAVSRRRLIGPIFFDGNLNAERYRNNILEPFVNQLHDDELQMGHFQQDSARPHIAHETIRYLEQFFGNRLISTDLFPPRSCDLTPLDYFLFPYLKNSIFKNQVHTIDDLRNGIIRQCEEIDENVLRNVFENMKRRVNLCLNVEGQHFQHLL